jgi:multidrug efflux system membrane fusion protein
MKLSMKSGLSLVVVAAGAALAFRFADAPAPMALPAAPAVPVVMGPVQQGDVPIILSGLGTVQALNTATIRSQVTGLLQTIDFVEGQQVHKDDVLAQIDPRPYQAHLAQTEAQLGHDQAQLANIEVNLNRTVPLLSHGFATDQQVTDQRSQVLQLQSTAKSDQASIDDARTQLSYATLTAPFDGITGVRRTDVGNIIHPTDADGLVTVTQVQPIGVLFTLPAADIAQVRDALAKGTVKAVAFDQADTQALDTGQLLLVNNQADPQSGTVQLKALFPNLQRRLWPGTFVNVELTTSVAKAALTIPNDAVQQGPQGTFAYVVGGGEKVAMRPIQVAQQQRGVALVSQGLSAGDTVVVQGQYRLTAGTIVVASKPSAVASSSTGTAGMLP